MSVEQLLFSYVRRKPLRDLSTMLALDAWIGSPHRNFSSIHVAGTNGKGSVALKIATALEAAGFRVGLFTSPHIEDVCERIQVNGVWIPKSFMERHLPELCSFCDRAQLDPSFFHLLTALSFLYFSEQKVDYAVMEVGLGGRLDATNVIHPCLSVLTSIAEDHQEILGKTLNAIAQEKAGIIKQGVPVVIGPRARLEPILSAARGREILVPEVSGFYDRENSAIARAALERLKVPLEAIERGLVVRPPCRFAVVDPTLPLILDVAHNVDGFQRLYEALEEFYPKTRFHVLFAMGKEKNAEECARALLPKASRISCFSNGHERLHSAEALTGLLRNHQIDAAPVTLDEVLPGREPLVCCGSFFIMGDIQKKVWKSLFINRGQPVEGMVDCRKNDFIDK
jgi:dihydrofolate synthase / folylpolyglutamate synthase